MRLSGNGTRRIAGIADQGVSSLGNLVVSLVVARQSTTSGLGAFAAAFLVYTLALGWLRAAVCEPLVVRHSGSDRIATAIKHGAGAAASTGFLLALAGLAVAGLSSGELRGSVLAVAVALPVLMVQDFARYAFVAQRRPIPALINDCLWLVLEVGVLAAMMAAGTRSAAILTVGWAATGMAAGIVGAVQLGVRPNPKFITTWWREHRDLSLRYSLENTAIVGARQIGTLVVGAILGLAALGTVRGALVILGPVTTLDIALSFIVVPEGVQALRSGRDSTVRLAALTAVGLTAATTLLTVVAMLLPASVGRQLLGSSWEAVREILPAMGVLVVLNGIASGAIIGLRILAAARESLRIRTVAAPVLLVGIVVGAYLAGLMGSIVGQAAATALTCFLAWKALLRASRSRPAPESPLAAGDIAVAEAPL